MGSFFPRRLVCAGLPSVASAVQRISGEDHVGYTPGPSLSVSIGGVCGGGGPLSYLRFPDDTDLNAGISSELQTLTDKLAASASTCEVEMYMDKCKVMVSTTRFTKAVIRMNGVQLEKLQNASSWKGNDQAPQNLEQKKWLLPHQTEALLISLVVSVMLYYWTKKTVVGSKSSKWNISGNSSGSPIGSRRRETSSATLSAAWYVSTGASARHCQATETEVVWWRTTGHPAEDGPPRLHWRRPTPRQAEENGWRKWTNSSLKDLLPREMTGPARDLCF